MNNQNNNNSNLPLVIIGLVLIAAIGGGWWFYTNSKAQPNSKKPGNINAPVLPTPPESVDYNAVAGKAPGAQPANALGSTSSPVVIEEFADYQCPTCATVHPKIKEINSIYGGRIRFIYRSFPLTQIHKNAYDAALAAEAAGQQGKFWAMQDQLFSNQQTWANSTDAHKIFEEYAQKIGLDITRFQTDMLGLPLKSRVDADMNRGQALKLTGTPSIFINGKQLAVEQMEVNTMRQIIESELQKPSNQSQSNQSSNSTVSASNQTVNSTIISK